MPFFDHLALYIEHNEAQSNLRLPLNLLVIHETKKNKLKKNNIIYLFLMISFSNKQIKSQKRTYVSRRF